MSVSAIYAVSVGFAAGPQQRKQWGMDDVKGDIPRGPLGAPNDRFKVCLCTRAHVLLLLLVLSMLLSLLLVVPPCLLNANAAFVLFVSALLVS